MLEQILSFVLEKQGPYIGIAFLAVIWFIERTERIKCQTEVKTQLEARLTDLDKSTEKVYTAVEVLAKYQEVAEVWKLEQMEQRIKGRQV